MPKPRQTGYGSLGNYAPGLADTIFVQTSLYSDSDVESRAAGNQRNLDCAYLNDIQKMRKPLQEALYGKMA